MNNVDIIESFIPILLYMPKFNFIDLFWQSDWIIKLVIFILLLCSIVCWAIIFQKFLKITHDRYTTKIFEQRFWSGTSIPELIEFISDKPQSCLELILLCCYEEWQRSHQQITIDQGRLTLQRIASLAHITIDQELQKSNRGLTLLATFSSTCPFIGLFGTVWGIINIFASIGENRQISLATVAPGISEVLLVTALGLITAIPATIAYNKFVNDIEQQVQNNEQFANIVIAIFSRQIHQVRKY